MRTPLRSLALVVFLLAALAARATIGTGLQAQLGNPSGATADPTNHARYLIQRAQYWLDYNDTTREANWVAWNLTSTDVGSSGRADFITATALPAAFTRVTPADYTNSGFDRGHMCPSGDRTVTQPINDQTYLMTNIIPQLPANNQGPWVDFENYCRSLAASGNEIYIFSGGVGNHTTIGASMDPDKRVVVPTTTWKVVLILPNGNDDLTRASVRSTRAFGVIMSNVSIWLGPPANQTRMHDLARCGSSAPFEYSPSWAAAARMRKN